MLVISEELVYGGKPNKWRKALMCSGHIFLIVSEHHGSGKSLAARMIANECFCPASIFEFGAPFWRAASIFHDGLKDAPDDSGVTKRAIAKAFSRALRELHSDLPTKKTKTEILDELELNEGVIILPDIRCPEEFEWVRSLSGVKVHVIEVAPYDTEGLLRDEWITPEVIELWGENRFIVLNDWSPAFTKDAVALCLAILENK